MTIDQFYQAILNFNIWFIAKIVVILALVLYTIFALIILRVTDLMTKTLTGIFTWPIKIIAWLHLIFSILVIIFAVLIL